MDGREGELTIYIICMCALCAFLGYSKAKGKYQGASEPRSVTRVYAPSSHAFVVVRNNNPGDISVGVDVESELISVSGGETTKIPVEYPHCITVDGSGVEVWFE